MDEYSWDPDSPYRLGLIYTLQGRRQLAGEYLNEALKREPEFPQVLNELARHHLRDNELTAAEKQLSLSLKFAPANIDALLLMAETQRRKGDIAKEIKYYNDAVVKTRQSRPAMLLADRLAELGKYENAVEIYERVMRSRQVDKLIRVTSAMMAGITAARYLNPAVDKKIYWHYVLNEFGEFKFFALQAKFLGGTLSEKDFRLQMGDLPAWKASAEYVIGLNKWLNGDSLSAVQAFERCLQVDAETKSRNKYSPQKWAQEDLARLKKNEPQNIE
jgi:lipopolysaccharide biosynthesis regulator YciM